MKFLEIEFKYRADNVSLEDFQYICKDPYKLVIASGYDYFYESDQTPGAFCRHRVGADMNQLTFKRKTASKNNYIRTEHNLNLADVKIDQVEALVAEFGYTKARSIFKSCFIYDFSDCIFVYYICYDEGMNELGRFIEIELAEDGRYASQKDAMKQLIKLETRLSPLGIKPKNRLRKSLFELFVQGN
jgi:adenylate cyclase class IV